VRAIRAIVCCVLPGLAIGSLIAPGAAWPWLPVVVVVWAALSGLWRIFQAAPRRRALRATLLHNWREDERAPHFRGVFVAACLAGGIAPPFTWLTFGLSTAACAVLSGVAAFCAMAFGHSTARAAVIALATYLAVGALMLVEDRRERGPGTEFPVPPNRPLTVAARIFLWPLVKARRVRLAAVRSMGKDDAEAGERPQGG
jgi:hypothetical protein